MTTDSTSTTPDRMDLPVARQPIHPILVSFSIACFVGAFITDIVYWRTVAVTWETFSIWLITVGLILAGLAIIAFVIDLVGRKHIRSLTWPFAIGYVVAVLLSLINAFIHSRDAYTAVVPTGLTLSGLVIVILLFSAGMGSALVYRHRIGAST
ncbi:DUF2231 domain-containing protein [Mesorhizobium escarrei]|uniref:Membrane protein n=1 Tax=Mesorhizobium escarrei TaxID=666018 RepID=A0ABM9DGU2_9HYPH|nr:DUF2231 domain-containing protein [Mesorhizobium escarrei]CAH2395686.1 Putative membrane protein [Mesorhizobium escarrei]